jgi:hypothetical protein
MNCQQCNTENKNEAKFCCVCGSTLPSNQQLNTSAKLSDNLLIIFLGITAFTFFLNTIIPMLFSKWYSGIGRYIMGFIWIINEASTMLIPFAIKNRVIRTLGIIIAAIATILWMYRTIAGYFF